MAEFEVEALKDGTVASEPKSLEAQKREIAALRNEVSILRERLSIHIRTAEHLKSPADLHPWLRIGATVAGTFLIGKIVKRLGLGAAGAAAVPLIVAQATARIR